MTSFAHGIVARSRTRIARARFGLLIAAILPLGLAAAAAPSAARAESSAALVAARVPPRSPGDVVPVSDVRGSRAPSLSTADTLTIYHADIEALSSPGNEGGWTHVDKSGTPTAWHIAPTVACQGNAFWAGLVDSSWTGDPDRRGYDNNWVQTLANYVDLTGATSPVKIGFKHRLNLETGFDFGRLQVFDPEFDWIDIASFTGKVPNSGVCDTFSVQIPDSIIAKNPILQFRFRMTSDIQGSSSDGLYPAAEGWSVDNVTVKAGAADVRFFDDMEAGIGTWTVSTFPAVGDFWRVASATNTQQLCSANTSKVWTPTEPVTGNLVVRIDDQLISPRVRVGGADQVFLSFDVYRNLPFGGCFYYGLAARSKKTGLPWSNWIDPTGLLYYGAETEWLRQSVTLSSAAGAESVQVRLEIKDYSAIFCDGIASASGTVLYIDNVDIRVIGSAGPSLATSESSLLNDTFRTTAFLGNDNFNTPRGDSTTVRIGASRGLKLGQFWYSLNGGVFTSSPLAPVGPAAPDIYFGDVPAAGYPRGTQLRYYFSATDSTDATATLPADAGSGHYFTATVLPATFAPTGSCPTDSARVLYVNSFAGPDAVTGVDQSLAALGIRYDRYDVNAASAGLGNAPGGGDPASNGVLWPGVSATALASMYSAIVWDVGERSQLTLSAQDQSLLTSWIASGGKNRGLILSGDNLAYDLTVNGAGGTFLSCAVGATYSRDNWETTPQDSLLPTLAGAAGTRIASEPFPLNGGCPGLNRFDALTVSACAGASGRAWIRYPNSLIAATERRAALAGTDSARAVLLGFSLSGMPSAARRNLLLWRTLVEEMETPTCTTPTSVELTEGVPSAPDRIDPPAPNPFNPETTIRFTVGRPGHVRVAVYNVAGARVRVLVDRRLQSGAHVVRWDGKDDRGRDVGSAAYFIHMDTAEGSRSRKAVLLR